MKKILYINGSPRGEKGSSSPLILKDIAAYLKDEGIRKEDAKVFTIPRSIKENTKSILETMDDADIWIIALPLYVDVLPGHLTWWLREYQNHRMSQENRKNIRVYGIVNCGFPEAIQNADALRVLEIFCRKSELEWRFGIGIGMGEPYKEMRAIPLRSWMKSEILASYKALGNDIHRDEAAPDSNYFVQVKYPRFLYRLQGAFGWIIRSRRNGVSRKAMYARPLLES
ncbi:MULTISPECIES: NAD(P)H-dependent oxidoreductase [unclassified Oceanispirochaeta]|uniref:NAD(P)H-dependent oxidoreductase n=1 Tax=unclassified Oceanispirochaeta TaxID=2635722 RepID=UPI000E0947CB|nr:MULTISPECIES: NAD(P)H-dependent oxidoreductase [unclassified Oceanispirochaeta]MBF9016299.1 hypothetical protein [Oceanispirochaeta sp. M2]NPD72762.1 hypothetical protein [Oceanispirochaeta sp. M1]RDG31608.1 hypothetical protein DV872_11685 [Oceanispirochaeta sp. M1]